jgi:hypothetical protein
MSDQEYDTDADSSVSCNSSNSFILTTMQYEIDKLTLQLELKSKDIEILERDVQIKNKEIENLQLRLQANVSQWI